MLGNLSDPQRNTASTRKDLAGNLETLAVVTSDFEKEQKSLDYGVSMGEV